MSLMNFENVVLLYYNRHFPNSQSFSWL